MTSPESIAETVTVSLDIQKWPVSSEEKLTQIYLEFKRAGWTGGIMAFAGQPSRLQLDRDGQQIISTVGHTIVAVNGIHTSLTAEEYAARYGA